MAHTFLLRNTPAFAFCSSFEGPYPCVLHIKHSESCGEASIYLTFRIHVRGSEEAQPFQLAYDADNWKALGLFPVNRGLDEHQLARIRWRDTSPDVMTLSLDLHQPCTVRCPPSLGCIAAKPGHESHFDQLRQLASAITVDLLFNIHYLNQNHAAFLQLISRSRDLTGVPAKAYNGPLSRQTDWTVFSPLEDNVPGAPPSYAAASAKPSRPGTGSLSPTRPLSKRRRVLSPASYSVLSPTAPPNFVAGSPTEKATTTTASPSPPSTPLHHASELEHMMETTIKAVLPGALAQLFAVDSSASDPTATPSIATRISTRIAADAGERLRVTYIRELDKLRTDTLNDAYNVRVTAGNEFFEELGDHKADLKIIKEEGITELRDQLESMVDELTETAEAIRDTTNAEMQEYAGVLCVEACERLSDAVVKEKARCMQRITTGWVARQDAHAGQGRRAASLPL